MHYIKVVFCSDKKKNFKINKPKQGPAYKFTTFIGFWINQCDLNTKSLGYARI